jgi:valyl-tRNA synthetase
VSVEVRAPVAAKRELIHRYRSIVENAARVTLNLEAAGDPIPTATARAVVGSDIEVLIKLEGLIDFTAERARIKRDLDKCDKEISFFEKKLANEAFVSRAPEDVVAEQRARLEEEQTRKLRLQEALASLEATT